MIIWGEYHRRVNDWRTGSCVEHIRLADEFDHSWTYRESDPERFLAILTHCRDGFQRLNEPWMVLFFEHWRLGALTADLHDFARALPLAHELMVRFSTPEGQAHACYESVYTGVLYTYLSIDPLGYRKEIEAGFRSLVNRIGPSSEDRFVYNYRWIEYLREIDRWPEGYEFLTAAYAAADRDSAWNKAWYLFLLCEACYSLGRMEELAEHARLMAVYSKQSDNLRRTLAAGLLWEAVALRARGDHGAASKLFHNGLRHLTNLSVGDEICADSIAAYYELGSEWREAVGVRDREHASVSRKGMAHRACRALVERCRLLARASTLTTADLEAARKAAALLRSPDSHLERLARIEAQNGAQP